MDKTELNHACQRSSRQFGAVATALVLLAGATYATSASAADWKPDKGIELIVPTGPGSGVDNTTRTLQAIMQTQKLVDTPIAVTNKAGGSYGVALNYLAQFPGDGHHLFVQTSTPLSALLTGQINIKYFEFTPIANLISEPIALVVRAESPITSAKELASRFKADPAAVSIALAAARGNSFHIAAALLAKASGADSRKLKIVVFGSSGDAMAALLGGHVDVLSVTPGNFLPLLESRKIRILGVASKARLSGPLAAVPTFKEQGYDVVIDLPRSVMGPKGMSAEQVRFWDGVFSRLVKTDAWRQAVEKNQWESDYMNSTDFAKDLKMQYDVTKDALTELGMVKQ